jgi:dTDP-4-dehydrorhamnose reductase
VIVHTAAWTDLDACEANPALARTLHRDATLALAEAAATAGARFVYVSTDSLFVRVPGPHSEDDPIDPRSVYAKTKREGEEASLTACSAALVLRTCIVGWNAQPKASLAEWILRELRAGRRIRAFTDTFFTPILTTTFSTAIERLVEREAHGILHVAGGECISKYDFALKLADTFGLPQALVVPSSSTDVSLKAPRPLRPCLDSSRFARLTGERLQTVNEALIELRRLEDSGWTARLRASIQV